MTYRSIVVIAAVATLSGSGAGHDNMRLGPVVEIASPAPAGSAEPNLAISPAGRAYVSWIELLPDSSHALRFSTLAPGRETAWTAPRTVATSAKNGWFVNWADFPSILPVDDNRLVAHWLTRSGTGKYAYNVTVASSRDAGRTWTAPSILHRDKSESEHGFVSLFRFGSTVGAVWLDGRKHAAAKSEHEAEMTLQFATLDARGTPTSELELDGRVCDCCQTAAAVTSNGPVVVYRDRSPNEVRDIAIVRMVNGRWTAPQLVHRDNWVIPACPVNGPAVSASGKSVVVAWFTSADQKARVYAAFSNNAGKSFGAPIRIDDGEPAGRVDVQHIGGGAAIVTWLERQGASAEVRVKEVRSNGRVSAAQTVASSNGERASGFPHVVYWRGTALFAWTQPGRPARVRTAKMELTRS